MYEFAADQVLGINGLVNFSNIVFLAAYSVRNVLWLRILAIVGEGMTLPYYYYQDEKLWPPIYWGVAFMIVNAVRIVGMALERRPVVFSDKEENSTASHSALSISENSLRLVSLARWVDCSLGEVIVGKGQQISDAIVLVSGDLEAILSNKTRIAVRPGQLIGDVRRLQRSGLSGGRSGSRSRNPCKVGPGAHKRVHGEQTGTPRQPPADCGEHGSCRQIVRCVLSRGRRYCVSNRRSSGMCVRRLKPCVASESCLPETFKPLSEPR